MVVVDKQKEGCVDGCIARAGWGGMGAFGRFGFELMDDERWEQRGRRWPWISS